LKPSISMTNTQPNAKQFISSRQLPCTGYHDKIHTCHKSRSMLLYVNFRTTRFTTNESKNEVLFVHRGHRTSHSNTCSFWDQIKSAAYWDDLDPF
jgi:hypothetical protein